MFRQHAVHDVLVDVDSGRLRNDQRDPSAAEPGIAGLELDDGLDECLVGPFRSGLLRARRGRKQPAVFATHQGLMNARSVEGRRAMATCRMRPGLPAGLVCPSETTDRIIDELGEHRVCQFGGRSDISGAADVTGRRSKKLAQERPPG